MMGMGALGTAGRATLFPFPFGEGAGERLYFCIIVRSSQNFEVGNPCSLMGAS